MQYRCWLFWIGGKITMPIPWMKKRNLGIYEAKDQYSVKLKSQKLIFNSWSSSRQWSILNFCRPSLLISLRSSGQHQASSSALKKIQILQTGQCKWNNDGWALWVSLIKVHEQSLKNGRSSRNDSAKPAPLSSPLATAIKDFSKRLFLM